MAACTTASKPHTTQVIFDSSLHKLWASSLCIMRPSTGRTYRKNAPVHLKILFADPVALEVERYQDF
ncbi:hypothetical protein M378DRAFT_162884 [Amanita muscaria Koide BX008]|uniref:Uncharacterized protein n=1 Tax=Amanita muscaria (strain Koide BX008) TaxID=946122 RepID=A0A0C2WSQ9_AMAMK|nr:hypothetical protein M378DRAFT_162884 [Amanita muscaria Koide BX008]